MLKVLISSLSTEAPLLRSASVEYLQHIFLWRSLCYHITSFYFATVNFLLCFSDIDLVVLGEWKQLPLFTLERALLEKGITNRDNIKVLDKASVGLVYEPLCEKTGLRGFRPGPTQTGLYSHRRWLEA